MRSEAEAARAIDLYADTVKRICMVHVKNEADLKNRMDAFCDELVMEKIEV